jgi:hypothetical protein
MSESAGVFFFEGGADDAAPQVGHHQPVILALGADADGGTDHAGQRHQRADGAVIDRALHAVRHVGDPVAQRRGDQRRVERRHGRELLADGFRFRQRIEFGQPCGGEIGRGVEPVAGHALEVSPSGRGQERLRELFGAGIQTGQRQCSGKLPIHAGPVACRHGCGQRQDDAQTRCRGRAALGGVDHAFHAGQCGAGAVEVGVFVDVEHQRGHGDYVCIVAGCALLEVGIDQRQHTFRIDGARACLHLCETLHHGAPRGFGRFDLV